MRIKLQKQNEYHRYRMTIPLYIVKELKLKKGQVLIVTTSNDMIIIKKVSTKL